MSLILYKHLRLCFDKSVLYWTFCQSLLQSSIWEKRKTQLHKNISFPKFLDSIFFAFKIKCVCFPLKIFCFQNTGLFDFLSIFKFQHLRWILLEKFWAPRLSIDFLSIFKFQHLRSILLQNFWAPHLSSQQG